MNRYLRRAVLLCAVLLLAAAPMLSVVAQGQVLADSGFRPQQHGFSFANYGNENNPVNLTANSMYQLFGASVCKTVKDGQCTLTTTAQEWMNKQNADMNGGHCEGMAALSKLIYTGQVKLSDLDPNAKTIADLKPDNPRVQEEIAKWFVTQATPPTATSELRDKTPSQVVDTLIEQLKPGSGPFTMGIYQADGSGGHAISPYSVIDMGNGIVRVMVYDNNYPGEERFIEVNRNTNTWKYTGTTNPDEPVSEYSGDASSFSLTLTPTTARTQLPQTCEFCQPGAAEVATGGQVTTEETTEQPTDTTSGTSGRAGNCGQTFVTTGPDTDFVVTNEQGQKAGFVDGQAFSEIDGVTVMRPRSQGGLAGDTPGAIISIPNDGSGGEMSMTMNSEGDTSDAMIYTCQGYQRVQGMSQKDGSPDTLTFDPNATYVTGDIDPDEQVSFKGGFSSLTGDDFAYELPDMQSDDGAIVSVGADPETGFFSIESDDDLEFDVNFTSINPNGEQFDSAYEDFASGAGQGLGFSLSDAVYSDDLEFEAYDADPAYFDFFSAARDDGEQTLSSLDDDSSSDDSGTGDDSGGDDSGTGDDNSSTNPSSTDEPGDDTSGSDDSGSGDDSGGDDDAGGDDDSGGDD